MSYFRRFFSGGVHPYTAKPGRLVGLRWTWTRIFILTNTERKLHAAWSVQSIFSGFLKEKKIVRFVSPRLLRWAWFPTASLLRGFSPRPIPPLFHRTPRLPRAVYTHLRIPLKSVQLRGYSCPSRFSSRVIKTYTSYETTVYYNDNYKLSYVFFFH